MTIGLIHECINLIPNPDGETVYHYHGPCVRTFDTIDEALEIVQSKFVECALDSNDVGAVVVGRKPDGGYVGALQWMNDDPSSVCDVDTIEALKAWLDVEHPKLAIGREPASKALN